jgi:hypothetical protein
MPPNDETRRGGNLERASESLSQDSSKNTAPPAALQAAPSERPVLRYDDLKALAADTRRPIRQLYALSSQNDPFFAGSPGRQRAAGWFANLWHTLDTQDGVHLRRIHYQLVSQREPIFRWDGAPYQNSLECSKALGAASVAARYLGSVPVDAFRDHRNPEPIDYIAEEESAGHLLISPDSPLVPWSPSPMPERPRLTVIRPDIAQRFHVEVWCEKTTVNDVLLPLAERYRLCLVTGAGELSVTRCHEFIGRATRRQRPVRILYVSDFDPAGRSMPVAVARKIEFFNLRDAGGALDIQLRPVVLTEEQCRKSALPRTPIKESERRAARFEARFGDGATELDALEALHPGVLDQILSDEILRYFDPTLDARLFAVLTDVSTKLDRITAEVDEKFAHRIKPLAVEWHAIQQDFEGRLQDWSDHAAPVWTDFRRALRKRAPKFDDIEWPEPEDGDEDPDALFDSRRSYLEQMDAYRRFQGRNPDQRDSDDDDGGRP